MAALESALGVVALVSVSALAFNLYSQASSQQTGLHAVVAVAEYVSREPKPTAQHIEDLATVVHEKFFAHLDATIMVLAVQGGTKKSTVLWTKEVKVDADASAGTPPAECSRFSGKDASDLPMKLEAGEVVVVAEVCLKQPDGVAYYYHILPARSDTAPVLQS